MIFIESEYIELKKSTGELKSGIISIASILNKHGKGKLYFGISNNGTVIGQDANEKTLRDISQAIGNHIEPKIYPEISKEVYKNKVYIKVSFQGKETPYFAYGRVYLRVADEDKQLSPAEIEKMILEKSIYKSHWDSELCNLIPKTIDSNILKKFILKSKSAGRLPVLDSTPDDVLIKLELIKNNKLTKAAKYLFTKEHDIELQLAVFATKERLTFLDIKNYKLPLLDMLDTAESYIKEKLNWKVEFVDFKRVEIPEIPIKAIREALVNSLIHRDFSNPKGNEVAIFKDRIEIYNPGSFPKGLTPEDYIKKQERSYLRNPKIAEIFYLTKDVEKWGSGLRRIYNECQENNINVSFNSIKTGFVITFSRPVKTDIFTSLPVNVGDVSGKTSGKTSGKIIKLIKENSYITIPEMALIIGVSNRSIERNLQKLQNNNKIKRVGPAKGGYWKIIDNKQL